MASVLFDLDGTLVETGPDLLAATNGVLAEEGVEPIALEHLGYLVGQGGRAMLERAFKLRGRAVGEAELDDYVPRFLELYERSIPGISEPYPGLRNALDRLEGAGHTLAVCTNKPQEMSVLLLEALDLADRFAAICGPDTFDVRKPNPEHIWKTIDRIGGDRREAVMVGDSISDIEAARRAGVPSIGVPFGYSDQPIRELNPTVVIERFDELDADLVANLLEKEGADR